jgi:hypothetical protein
MRLSVLSTPLNPAERHRLPFAQRRIHVMQVLAHYPALRPPYEAQVPTLSLFSRSESAQRYQTILAATARRCRSSIHSGPDHCFR